jgi:hypothetical protein
MYVTGVYPYILWAHMDTAERFYIYKEMKNDNQLNDKHTVSENQIFKTILKEIRSIDQPSLLKTYHVNTPSVDTLHMQCCHNIAYFRQWTPRKPEQ